jgi:hypothetical protein
MKTFILAAGLFLASPVLAQNTQNYSAVCINIESLAELVTEFGEDASLTMTSVRETVSGNTVKIPTVLFINYETKSWTLVERVERNRFCVIATGENVAPYVKK